MRWLPFLAIALIALWVAARVLGFLVGVSLNLIGIAAILLLVVWGMQRLR